MQANDGIGWNPGPIEGIDSAKRLERPKIVRIGETPGDSRFKELLEDIERLRIQGKKLSEEPGPSEITANDMSSAKKGTEDLDQAMDLADQTHETAMDMRRSLEDAFRRHMKA